MRRFSILFAVVLMTGECQRFDGVWVFPIDWNLYPNILCEKVYNGLWVPHDMSEVPNTIKNIKEPTFFPYRNQS